MTMKELISRQVVLAEVAAWLEGLQDKHLIAILEEIPVENFPRWISVEERLPTLGDASANELVICVCRGEDGKPIAEEVHAWHFDVVRRMAPCFTHWMPMNALFSLLPEPTKEDRS